MSLHNEIMNIQIDRQKESQAVMSQDEVDLAYRKGHRDARHDAAELSLKYEALIEKLLGALERRHADDYVDSIRQEYNLYE
jgi:hypothetical protein